MIQSYLVLGKDGGPTLRGSRSEMNDGPPNGKRPHTRSFDTNELAIGRARRKSLRQGGDGFHVRQVIGGVGEFRQDGRGILNRGGI